MHVPYMTYKSYFQPFFIKISRLNFYCGEMRRKVIGSEFAENEAKSNISEYIKLY